MRTVRINNPGCEYFTAGEHYYYQGPGKDSKYLPATIYLTNIKHGGGSFMAYNKWKKWLANGQAEFVT